MPGVQETPGLDIGEVASIPGVQETPRLVVVEVVLSHSVILLLGAVEVVESVLDVSGLADTPAQEQG
jgi:hypothetical protein